ncbi:hypothetical protein ISS37_10320 [candidate division KSB1 bacterium]|nr:hypothetical protein [candidate division KSB1 bacterium]
MEGKKKIIILMALVFFLALAWFLVLRNPGQGATVQTWVSDDDQRIEVALIDNIIQEIQDLKGPVEGDLGSELTTLATLDLGRVRDPFTFVEQKKSIGRKKPPGGKKRNMRIPRLDLTGIIFDREKPAAIINGEVYIEGNIVKGFRVVRISKSGVKLVSKEIQIYLKAPEFD